MRLWMERGAGQANAFELSRRSRKQHLSRRWGRTMLRRHFVPDSPWPRGAAPGTTRRGARGNMGGCSRFLKVLGSPPLFSAGRRILCEVALREPHSGATRRPNEGVRSQSDRPEKHFCRGTVGNNAAPAVCVRHPTAPAGAPQAPRHEASATEADVDRCSIGFGEPSDASGGTAART